jgi:two-component system nitrate/nitrite response regulator NarL
MRTLRERVRVLSISATNMGSGLLADALRRSSNRFDVVGLVGSSYHVSSELGKYNPHVALISAELQDGPQAGFSVLEHLREICPTTAAVMLLDSSRPEVVVEAFRKGARGVFCTVCSFKALPKCIHCVYQGQIWASNADLEHVLKALTHFVSRPLRADDGTPLLTRREEEVVSFVTDGMRNRDIAENLRITEHSVRNYLSRIFEKVGVSNRVELILYVLARQHPSTAHFARQLPKMSDQPGLDASRISGAPPKSSNPSHVSNKTVHHAALTTAGRKEAIQQRNWSRK